MSVGEVLARVRELSMPQGTQPEQTAGASPSQGTPQTHCAPARPAIPLVELTGGEPLLQPDVYPLADKLLAAGYTVLMETRGERYVGKLPREAVKIMDLKGPDSGEAGTLQPAHLAAR